MEKKTDGMMKSAASIPENYISILQLQERWIKEKERKHKETDLGVKQPQQVNGQRRREEVKEPKVNLVGRFPHINPPKKERNCIEKKEAEVSAVMSKEEDGGDSRERKKNRSKKKNQGGSVKEVVVKCVSKAYIPKEIKPVKEEIQREKTVQNRENTAACNPLALESQFQHLQIKKRVEDDRSDIEVKEPARWNSGQGYYRNPKRQTRTMAWVKKGEQNATGGGNGFNV